MGTATTPGSRKSLVEAVCWFGPCLCTGFVSEEDDHDLHWEALKLLLD